MITHVDHHAPMSARVSAPMAREYDRLYDRVRRTFGKRAPGCNLLRGFCHEKATATRVEVSIGVLARWFVPAISSPIYRESSQPALVAGSATTATKPQPEATMASGALPTCTWQPESGGNPSAVNSSSGAGGYYQIMPSTWAAYGGTGAPQNASLSQQTAVAQKIWANQGPSAWTNC